MNHQIYSFLQSCSIIMLLIIGVATQTFAQSGPVCTFNYQAVVRDGQDNVIPNRDITVQLTVLDGPGGLALYVEQHDATTSSLGLITLEVGAGITVGGILAFEAIPWATRRHFLRVDVDLAGGTNFTILGESPILAVPIAVQSKVAAVAISSMDTIKRIDTLRVDTLRVKKIFADNVCTDTIIAKIGVIDTLISEKVSTADLCADTVKAPIGLFGELGARFAAIDTLVSDKIFAKDICTDTLKTPIGVVGDLIAASGFFDTLDAGKIFATDLCPDTIRSPLGIFGELAGGIGTFDTLDADKVFARDICADTIISPNGIFGDFVGDNASIDTMVSGKITVENLCADTSFGALGVFPDLAADNAFIDTLEVNKIFANSVCADTLLAQSGVMLDAAVENLKIVGGSLCMQNEEGDTAFLVLPDGTSLHNGFEIFRGGFGAVNSDNSPIMIVQPDQLASDQYGITTFGNMMINGIVEASIVQAGLLQASTKSFVIDHPLDPENKTLRHFSIESDQMVNIYNGIAELDDHGSAWVEMPAWFEALNTDVSYQLTCIGGYSQVYIAQEIRDNMFQIAGGKPGLKVSWQVSGVRHDPQALALELEVEEEK